MHYILCISSQRSLIHFSPRKALLPLSLHAILTLIFMPLLYLVACPLASTQSIDDHTTVMRYMLCFSSQHRAEPRAAALGQSHSVLFDVVVMSTILDYYLSRAYHRIAAEHIIHSDNMFSFAMIFIKF